LQSVAPLSVITSRSMPYRSTQMQFSSQIIEPDFYGRRQPFQGVALKDPQ